MIFIDLKKKEDGTQKLNKFKNKTKRKEEEQMKKNEEKQTERGSRIRRNKASTAANQSFPVPSDISNINCYY